MDDVTIFHSVLPAETPAGSALERFMAMPLAEKADVLRCFADTSIPGPDAEMDRTTLGIFRRFVQSVCAVEGFR